MDCWGHFEAALRAVRALADARGVRLSGVALPVRALLRPGDLDAPRVERTYARMLEVAARAGAPALDTMPLFREAAGAEGEPKWFWPGDWDPHLSAEGNRLLARFLHERIDWAVR